MKTSSSKPSSRSAPGPVLDTFHLPGWSVEQEAFVDGAYEITATYKKLPRGCPLCEVENYLYKHGVRTITYRDVPLNGYPVRILAQVQRFQCRNCTQTFLQPLAGIRENHRLTRRCAAYIEKLFAGYTSCSLARHIGMDEKSIRNIGKAKRAARRKS